MLLATENEIIYQLRRKLKDKKRSKEKVMDEKSERNK
jgi:hypothetical protein